MKVLVVGDGYIRPEALEKACERFQDPSIQVDSLFYGEEDSEWQQKDHLLIEKYGPEAVPVPRHVAESLPGVEILLVHRCPVSRRLLEAGDSLRVVGVCRGGYENIDVAAATDLGIKVLHLVGRNAEAVSDFTVGMMLAELRNIARSHRDVMAGSWVKHYGNDGRILELRACTVGLVGFGAIGRLVARKLSGFGSRILAFDPHVPSSDIREAGAEPTSLNQLFQQADIVSVHARLLPETERLIGDEQIRLMKKDAYFINTARAGLVEETALLKALQEKRIAGAALDVFWEEPLPPDSQWTKLDNVTLAAHFAGTTRDAFARTPALLVEEVSTFLANGASPGLLNP